MTAAAGAGLGLSIVDKTVQRMGGIFALANSSTGGLVAHLGTNDLREVEARVAAGDEKATLVFKALCLQIAKEIGACW